MSFPSPATFSPRYLHRTPSEGPLRPTTSIASVTPHRIYMLCCPAEYAGDKIAEGRDKTACHSHLANQSNAAYVLPEHAGPVPIEGADGMVEPASGVCPKTCLHHLNLSSKLPVCCCLPTNLLNPIKGDKRLYCLMAVVN